MKATLTNGRTVAYTMMKHLQRMFRAAQHPRPTPLTMLFKRQQDVYVEAPGFTRKKFNAQQRRLNKTHKRISAQICIYIYIYK